MASTTWAIRHRRIAPLNPPEGSALPLPRMMLDSQLRLCNIRFGAERPSTIGRHAAWAGRLKALPTDLGEEIAAGRAAAAA